VNLPPDLNRLSFYHRRLSSAADRILKGPVAYLPFSVHGLGLSGLPLEAALRFQPSPLHRPRLQMALRNQAGHLRDDTYGDLVGR
jgi:hypothetical protein